MKMSTDAGPLCLSVINMKGGVGKTTIAASLARYAARRYAATGRRVLAVDLDPQANLSQALMGEIAYRRFLDDRAPSIAEVFDGYLPPGSGSGSATNLSASAVVQSTSYTNLDVLPSRFDFADRLVSAINPNPRCLARLIADSFQDRDLVIIDCAPTESVFTKAAYHASRYVLVPVRPEFFATIGFPLLNDSLQDYRRSNQAQQIDVIGIVINDANYQMRNRGGPERRRSMGQIRDEAAARKWHIFSTEIKYSRGFPKLMRGDTTYLGDAEKEIRRFANEFFARPELRKLGLDHPNESS